MTREPPGDDALAEMLDQPGGQDPFHPHMLVKPSADVPSDSQRLIAAIERMAALHNEGRRFPLSQADEWANACTSLIARLRGAISGDSNGPSVAVSQLRKRQCLSLKKTEA